MDLRMFIDLFQEIEVENLFKAFMEYASPELKAYYDEQTKEV